MYLDKEEKQKIFKDHGRLKKNNDTGSAESQIALFTYRIKHLTDHLRTCLLYTSPSPRDS